MSDPLDKVVSSLGTILRYIAPGFVALFCLSTVSLEFSVFEVDGVQAWAVVVGASLVGVMIYAVHNGVFIRGIWWPLIVWLHLKKKKHPFMPDRYKDKSVRDVMWELDTERWKRRSSVDTEVKTIQAQFDKWAELLNFMYCSSYAMIGLPFYTELMACLNLICSKGIKSCRWAIPAVGLFILFCALISEYGITKRALWAAKEYPGGQKEG